MTRRAVRTIDVVLEDARWKKVSAPVRTRMKRAALRTLEHEKSKGSLTILLGSDARLKALNGLFRGKNKPTNVLSFPADENPDAYLGDVAIAHETLMREAAAEGKRPDGHLSHLVAHGVLHLLGFDHENDRDAEKMESLETRILKNLGFPDPYAARAEETA